MRLSKAWTGLHNHSALPAHQLKTSWQPSVIWLMGLELPSKRFSGTAEFIQDLIAFKDIGGDVIEVTQSFMSGAAGIQKLPQMGFYCKREHHYHKKGLDQLTGSELEWAKAQERVAVAEQQKNAFGATEREWDMMLSVQALKGRDKTAEGIHWRKR